MAHQAWYNASRCCPHPVKDICIRNTAIRLGAPVKSGICAGVQRVAGDVIAAPELLETGEQQEQRQQHGTGAAHAAPPAGHQLQPVLPVGLQQHQKQRYTADAVAPAIAGIPGDSTLDVSPRNTAAGNSSTADPSEHRFALAADVGSSSCIGLSSSSSHVFGEADAEACCELPAAEQAQQQLLMQQHRERLLSHAQATTSGARSGPSTGISSRDRQQDVGSTQAEHQREQHLQHAGVAELSEVSVSSRSFGSFLPTIGGISSNANPSSSSSSSSSRSLQQLRKQLVRPLQGTGAKGARACTPSQLAALSELLHMPVPATHKLLERCPELQQQQPALLQATVQQLAQQLSISYRDAAFIAVKQPRKLLLRPAAEVAAAAEALAEALSVPAAAVTAAAATVPSLLARPVPTLQQRLENICSWFAVRPAAVLQMVADAPELLTDSGSGLQQRLQALQAIFNLKPISAQRLAAAFPRALFISPRILNNKLRVLMAILQKDQKAVGQIVYKTPQLLRFNLERMRVCYQLLPLLLQRNQSFVFAMMAHNGRLLLQPPAKLLVKGARLLALLQTVPAWQQQWQQWRPPLVEQVFALSPSRLDRLEYLLVTQQAAGIELWQAAQMPSRDFAQQFSSWPAWKAAAVQQRAKQQQQQRQRQQMRQQAAQEALQRQRLRQQQQVQDPDLALDRLWVHQQAQQHSQQQQQQQQRQQQQQGQADQLPMQLQGKQQAGVQQPWPQAVVLQSPDLGAAGMAGAGAGDACFDAFAAVQLSPEQQQLQAAYQQLVRQQLQVLQQQHRLRQVQWQQHRLQRQQCKVLQRPLGRHRQQSLLPAAEQQPHQGQQQHQQLALQRLQQQFTARQQHGSQGWQLSGQGNRALARPRPGAQQHLELQLQQQVDPQHRQQQQQHGSDVPWQGAFLQQHCCQQQGPGLPGIRAVEQSERSCTGGQPGHGHKGGSSRHAGTDQLVALTLEGHCDSSTQDGGSGNSSSSSSRCSDSALQQPPALAAVSQGQQAPDEALVLLQTAHHWEQEPQRGLQHWGQPLVLPGPQQQQQQRQRQQQQQQQADGHHHLHQQQQQHQGQQQGHEQELWFQEALPGQWQQAGQLLQQQAHHHHQQQQGQLGQLQPLPQQQQQQQQEHVMEPLPVVAAQVGVGVYGHEADQPPVTTPRQQQRRRQQQQQLPQFAQPHRSRGAGSPGARQQLQGVGGSAPLWQAATASCGST